MKIVVERKLQDYLSEFDLTEREILIYLTLLHTGPNTIMNLARETGIKRSTTHNNVEELVKKGLVSQTSYGERRMVVAEDPEKLKLLLDQKKWRMRKVEETLPMVVQDIQKMVPKSRENTKVEVKYYDGKDGTSIIYKEAFMSKELRSYVNLEETARIFPENKGIYLESRERNPTGKVWEIIKATDDNKKLAKMYANQSHFEYKMADDVLGVSLINILIYDGKVAVINYDDKVTGTVIHNKHYFDHSAAVFDVMWNGLEKIK